MLSIATSDFSTLFKANLKYLSSLSSTFSDLLNPIKDSLSVEKNDENRLVITYCGEVWIQAFEASLLKQFATDTEVTDTVRMQRMRQSPESEEILSDSSNALLSKIIGASEYIALSHLPSLELNQNQFTGECRNVVLLGSLSLLYLNFIKPNAFDSFLLVESDPVQFAVLLHLIDFEELTDNLKKIGLGFSLLLETIQLDLGPRILDHYATGNSLSLHGLRVFKSPKLSPTLYQAHAWIHAQDGLLHLARGFLGNDTDEINQCLHSVCNSLHDFESLLLTSDIISSNETAVLTASGPSLDQQLPLLKQFEDSLFIVACGSSLGSLLAAGITPSALVLLEMDSKVFEDLNILLLQGYDLSSIVLFASDTIDPRISPLFKKTIYFHRPRSAAFALYPFEENAILPQAGPQVANAGLEVLLVLGFRKLLFIGCDFGAESSHLIRSANAVGQSNRIMDMPSRSNRRRTIFSSDELRVTRDLFQNMIRLYEPECFSFGHGIEIKGVRNVSDNDRQTCLFNCSCEPSLIIECLLGKSIVREHRSRLIQRLEEILEGAQKSNDELSERLHAAISRAPVWSHELSRDLSVSTDLSDEHLTASARFNNRIFRFLYFFAFQPLYDCLSVDSERWLIAKEKTHASVSFVQSLSSSYLSLLRMLLSASSDFLMDKHTVQRLLLEKLDR